MVGVNDVTLKDEGDPYSSQLLKKINTVYCNYAAEGNIDELFAIRQYFTIPIFSYH